MGADPAETARSVERLRPLTDKPLIVKLTPNATDPAEVAHAAEEAGADAVSLINTLKGDGARPAHAASRGSVPEAAACPGPAVQADRPRAAQRGRQRVEMPVIGMGGIATGRDARDFLAAGAAASPSARRASAIPLAGRRIAAELGVISRNERGFLPASDGSERKL